MGDVNLEIKLNNIDERVIKIEESGGSGGDGYITSVSDDFNVLNKKLSLSNDVTTKLSNVDNKIDKPTSATEGQVLTYRNNEWVADDSQGGGGQFVIIAKGENYEGQTVTATKGTKSKSAVITSGVARIPVDEGGVWTLTLSSGETFNTPNMTYYGEYEVALLPNGSTVTPTNDIQTWLKCAGLNKSYTTMSEVLADTNTLSALISNNNAVDYMVRSTTWASDVCSNESAMTYIGLNNYCANKLLADSTWCTAICNSTYFKKVLNVKVPTLTADSALVLASNVYDNSGYKAYYAFDNNTTTLWAAKNTTNEYVGYDFEKPVYVKKVSYIQSNESSKYRAKNIRVDGFDGSQWKSIKTDVAQQNTNIQWIDLSDNKTSYTKYRMYIIDSYSDSVIELAELQFYGREA